MHVTKSNGPVTPLMAVTDKYDGIEILPQFHRSTTAEACVPGRGNRQICMVPDDSGTIVLRIATVLLSDTAVKCSVSGTP